MTAIDAVVLAGSANDGRLKECSDKTYEALVEISDKPMVSYVVDTLVKSPAVNRIVIAGPLTEMKSLFGHMEQVLLTEAGRTPIESLMRALDVLKPEGNVLVATSDIPLLSIAAVTDFIKRCSRKLADIYYPIVPKDENDRFFPGVKRTYVKFKEGVFTGGNLFLINPQVARQCADRAETFVQKRKSPFALAKLVGGKFLIRFLLHQITLEEAETTVSRIFGIKGKVIISPFPEVGIDVDKPSDLMLVREAMSKILKNNLP